MLSDKEFWEQMVLDALKAKAEYNFLDFKLSLSEDSERLKEHINAFGHLERGGCFVFGVKNYIPLGIQEDADKIIQKITHLALDTQEPKLNVDAFPLDLEGKQLLGIHILPSSSKPIFIKDRQPMGGSACFKRTGSSTVPMSIQEIKDLLAGAEENYYDESEVKDANLDHLDFDKLCSVRLGAWVTH
ncbi:MAG: helix-turn-helix domain-containing protein [Candidatus Berkiella sp.]